MKRFSIKTIASSLVAAGVLAFSGNALAAGPLLICQNGQPYLWPAGGANVPFNPDQGGLGILNNAEAVARVEQSYQAWEDVASASISYQNNGLLPVDVDETNFAPFLNAAAPDGLSAIVFDEDGAIFDVLFGPGSGILGFATPEWASPATCEIIEGLSFLNGPAIGTVEGLLDLMVHEFGHYSNLAHTTVNGQLFIGVGDTSGPNPDNTFGLPPNPDNAEVIETMYPFLFGGIDQVSRTPNADDVASISQLYPEASFATTTATIEGSVFLGANRVTGVNVIARNVSNPFFDAVSAITSDFTDDFSQANPLTGVYTIRNLTPGAEYAVYVDEILAGGFSTPPASPLPGPEEFHSGALESSDGSTDIPNEFTTVSAAAGATASGIDVIFNSPQPGDDLNTGDDGNVQVALPFPYCIAGQAYDSVYINGNGFMTFGAPAEGLTFIESGAAFVTGPPRIAGFWDDLNVTEGGRIFYEIKGNEFFVTWENVPEFFFGGSNTFTIKITDNSKRCLPDGENTGVRPKWWDLNIHHYGLTSPDGLVGASAGSFATSGFETSVDLDDVSKNRTKGINMRSSAAVYEQFSFNVDIGDDSSFTFKGYSKEYADRFENNNSLADASIANLPFDTIPTRTKFSSIAPAAADIDFYRLKNKLRAGETLIAEVVTGQIDSVLGVFQCDNDSSKPAKSNPCDPATAQLVAFNDDANGLLSRIEYTVPEDGTYAIGVTFCCDYDFDGVDPGQGAPFDEGRYVLDVFTLPPGLLLLGDDDTAEVSLDFAFPFQGGSYTSVWVNSNGNLTFGEGDTDFSESIAELEAAPPRIAPLWDDLNPSAGGFITALGDGSSFTVSFTDISEFPAGNSNTFSVTLYPSGEIDIAYGNVDAVDGIVGVSAGDGSIGTAVDLSSGGPFSATGTTYEQFLFGSNEFDLSGLSISFEP